MKHPILVELVPIWFNSMIIKMAALKYQYHLGKK